MADTTYVDGGPPRVTAAWLQDLNNFFYRGAPANIVAATTKVVTPLVATATDVQLALGINGVAQWSVRPSSGNFDFYPTITDNTASIGIATNRVKQVFTPIIDSGPASTLSLRTNGLTGIRVENVASAVNFVSIFPNSTGNPPTILANGSDANPVLLLGTVGTGAVQFLTNFGAGGVTQFQVLHTALSNRNITVTGAISPNHPLIGSTSGIVGFANNILLPYSASYLSVDNAGTGTITVAVTATVNGVINVLEVGGGSGVLVRGAVRAGAPTANDLPLNGQFTVWNDTVGNTTKLYASIGGVLKSVALT